MNPPLQALDARFWRMLSIRWQRQPLGSGSHLTGGRWNAVGVKALYLADDHSTAIAEYYRSLVRPGTLAAYDVRAPAIIDLTRADVRETIGLDAAILNCDWETIYAIDHGIPPSWTL